VKEQKFSRSSFPVLDALPEIQNCLLHNSSLVLKSPPGSGKSTILPLFLFREPWLADKKIVILEPRRLAARSVAARLADQLEEELGQTVGYRIRFESRQSSQTKILVVTEGILVRMLQQDPSLQEVGLVIFDEFHERSLQADLSLVLTLESIRIFRPDLKILVMSATLDDENLSRFLKAPMVRCEGKVFPIEFRYRPLEQQKLLSVQVASLTLKALQETNGDLLVFLPGTAEINKCYDLLLAESLDTEVLKLYGDLPFQEQQRVLLPDRSGKRKIILSTSIAETSLTIEGISTVVDGGFSRVPKLDPGSGLTRLVTIPVTADSATQRAGRAGRIGPGVCYRLWAVHQNANLITTRKPEILEADLSSVLLEILSWGIGDPFKLEWPDAPPSGHVEQAFDLLSMLGAVENRQITAMGRRMSELPLHPRLSKMLLAAPVHLRAMACDLAALLEEKDPLPKNSGTDLSLRLALLRKFRVGDKVGSDHHLLTRITKLSALWQKMLGWSDRTDTSEIQDHTIGQLMALAYPDRIARQMGRHNERYRLGNGRTLMLDKNDPLINSGWIVVPSADAGQSQGRIFLACSFDPDKFPEMVHHHQVLVWDDSGQQIKQAEQKLIGSLIVSERTVGVSKAEEAQSLIIQKIRENGLSWAGALNTAEQLLSRIGSLKNWRTNEAWPSVLESDLLSTLEHWLLPFLLNVYSRAALERLDWNEIFRSMLPFELQGRLDTLAPEKLEVPSGSRIAIRYMTNGDTPELHVRLQEVFGWTETPRINQGTIPIKIYLLSPGFKPVQVTGDLKSFWSNAYHEVRKELRARYPKHSWPEDPWSAVAVRGVPKRKG